MKGRDAGDRQVSSPWQRGGVGGGRGGTWQ